MIETIVIEGNYTKRKPQMLTQLIFLLLVVCI